MSYVYSTMRIETQKRSDDTELNQARPKPDIVNRPLYTIIIVQYCSTWTVS